jgi:hypothetical protein
MQDVIDLYHSLYNPHKDKQWYTIDATKIKTVEDIATILEAMDIKLLENHEATSKIQHLLKPIDFSQKHVEL